MLLVQNTIKIMPYNFPTIYHKSHILCLATSHDSPKMYCFLRKTGIDQMGTGNYGEIISFLSLSQKGRHQLAIPIPRNIELDMRSCSTIHKPHLICQTKSVCVTHQDNWWERSGESQYKKTCLELLSYLLYCHSLEKYEPNTVFLYGFRFGWMLFQPSYLSLFSQSHANPLFDFS